MTSYVAVNLLNELAKVGLWELLRRGEEADEILLEYLQANGGREVAEAWNVVKRFSFRSLSGNKLHPQYDERGGGQGMYREFISELIQLCKRFGIGLDRRDLDSPIYLQQLHEGYLKHLTEMPEDLYEKCRDGKGMVVILGREGHRERT